MYNLSKDPLLEYIHNSKKDKSKEKNGQQASTDNSQKKDILKWGINKRKGPQDFFRRRCKLKSHYNQYHCSLTTMAEIQDTQKQLVLVKNADM